MKSFFYSLPLVAILIISSGCAGQHPSEKISKAATQSERLTHLYQYHLTDAQNRPVSLADLLQQTQDADVIMVGEWHGHPGVHLFQAELLAALAAQEGELALSMEHFTRADQPVLNQYLAGEIGEYGLTSKAKVWDNYKSDYRPLVEIARHNELPVIAANAPRNIVRCIGRKGTAYLDNLSPEQRGLVAATIDVSDSPYKQTFVDMMGGVTMPEERLNQMFAAQLTWDATMAESIVRHKQANSDAKIYHVAGRFHVMNGIGTGAEILKLQPGLKVAYISASTHDDPVTNTTDYRLHVQPLPPVIVTQEEQGQAFYSHSHKRSSSLDCDQPSLAMQGNAS